MKYSFLKLGLILLLAGNLFAQSTTKIYGVVRDAENRLPLAGANVLVKGTNSGSSTDENGYYAIENIFAGSYAIEVIYVGYQSKIISNVNVSQDMPLRLDIFLNLKILPSKAIIVTANKSDQPAFEFASISNEELKKTNSSSAEELLNNIAGLEVEKSAGPGSAAKITIRGSQANQVLILMDGVPLNDGLSGAVDISQIPINIIERIEIYKGGVSPLFGSGAIGGAVNIITRRNFKNEFQLKGMAGAFGFYEGEGLWSGSYNKFAMHTSVKYSEVKGDYSYLSTVRDTVTATRLNADLQSLNIFSRINYSLKKHQFSVLASWFNSERGFPGDITRLSAYARGILNRTSARAFYTGKIKKFIVLSDFGWALDENHNSNLFPDDSKLQYRGYGFKYDYLYELQTLSFNNSVEYEPLNWWNVQLKANWLQQDYLNKDKINTNKVEAQDKTLGVALLQKFSAKLPFYSAEITLNPLLRYDNIKMSSDAVTRKEEVWSPGAGLYASIGTRYKFYLKSNITQSFRMPTFSDLFYQEIRVVGKADLLPEKSVNKEISLGSDINIFGTANFQFTHFNYSIDNLIVWKLGSFGVFSPFNTNAFIKGNEYQFRYALPENLVTYQISYSTQDALNKQEGETTFNKIIPYRAQTSLKSSLEANYKSMHTALKYRHSGKRFVNESNTKFLAAYEVLDFELGYKHQIKKIMLHYKFSLYNLLNEKYEVIRNYPLPGREWRLGLQVSY